MKKKMKLGLPVILMIVLVMCFFSARSMEDIEAYGKLINYVGIVRGASQRVIKLETNQMPNDELIDYISGILSELLSGEGEYGLQRTKDEAFNKDLIDLDKKWELIKKEILQIRRGKEKNELLEYSEELFDVANKAVFSIEEYSRKQSATLAGELIIMAVFCLLLSVIVIVFYIKRYFQLRRTTELLADQAGRDKLTGALDTERFEREARDIINQHPDQKFAVQYMDFENFKYINDVFGYETGDKVLKKYTEIMKASLRENELFGRSVADCFLALRCYEEKEELLERQMKIDKTFVNYDVLPENHDITVVCGICCFEDVIEDLDVVDLINRANYAKKIVKNNPKEHYGFYNEDMRRKMFSEIKIADRMESALENKEFLVYYQPKVSPATGFVRGAEALVRWRYPDGTFCLPGEFIPVFEKNHSISQLDMYVYEEVCRYLQSRIRQGRPIVPVSVNVSKIRFYTPGFVKGYTEIKNRYGIPDGILEIEFTETVACENLEYMSRIVQELHANGFLCSLDDFGTGYSSLGMLNLMEIDVLKMDAVFFRSSNDPVKTRIIIEGILGMVNKLDLHTVAEGIETKEQAEFLGKCGCDLIQGYYYYRPMPEKEFTKVLDENTGLHLQPDREEKREHE